MVDKLGLVRYINVMAGTESVSSHQMKCSHTQYLDEIWSVLSFNKDMIKSLQALRALPNDEWEALIEGNAHIEAIITALTDIEDILDS